MSFIYGMRSGETGVFAFKGSVCQGAGWQYCLHDDYY
jgi:hypothetical protein